MSERRKKLKGRVRRGRRMEQNQAHDSPCTRQTSLCTCASANFRESIVVDDDDDVEVVGERGACTTAAIQNWIFVLRLVQVT